MNCLYLLTILSLTLVLAACGSWRMNSLYDESKADQTQIEQLITQMREQPRQITPAAEMVGASPHTLLLNSELIATYHKVPLRHVIARIITGYPIIWEIPKDINPLITNSAAATTVQAHLNTIAIQANVGFQFIDHVFVVSETITRKFNIPAFGNASANTAGVSYAVSANNLNAAFSSSDFRNSANYRINIYQELVELVKSVTNLMPCASLPGADLPNQTDTTCYSVSGAANLLTLSATPRQMQAFEQAFRNWQKAINRSAEVTLKIVEIDVTDLTQKSFDFSLIRNGAITAALDATTNGLVNISQGAGVLRFDFNEGNRYDGSQLIIQALRQVGDITSVETKEFQLLNNRLLTVRNFTNERFIQDISIQDTSSGGTTLSTPSITQGELSVGQAVNIMPTIADNMIYMHIVYNNAVLDRLVPFAIGETVSGQIPIDSGSDNVFDVTLEDGETVMLASSHRKVVDVSKEDPLASGFWPFSRTSQSAEKRVTQTLFIISANIN